jgi:hypothetical protein
VVRDSAPYVAAAAWFTASGLEYGGLSHPGRPADETPAAEGENGPPLPRVAAKMR